MRVGYWKIITATLLFSVNPVLFKAISLDAIEILWTVNLVALLALVTANVVRRRTKELVSLRHSAGTVAGLAIAFTLNNALFISAIKVTTIANGVLTHYLAPVCVVLFAMLLIKEKATRRSVSALVLSLGGLVVILWPNEISFTNQHFLGLTLGTLSAVFFALEIILKKMLVRRHRADAVVAVYLMISVLLLAPAISFGEIASVDWPSLGMLVVSGLVVSGLGITLFTAALRVVKAQHAGIISYLEPLGAIVLGITVIGESPTLSTLIGGALILSGTCFVVSAPSDLDASPPRELSPARSGRRDQ
jgi:drug/metabolite transporter (DMT)-like permease